MPPSPTSPRPVPRKSREAKLTRSSSTDRSSSSASFASSRSASSVSGARGVFINCWTTTPSKRTLMSSSNSIPRSSVTSSRYPFAA